MKKAARFFSSLLSVVLALTLLFSAYVFYATLRAGKGKVPEVFGYSFLQVATGSMEPTIPTGVLVIMRETDADAINVGDIICFYSTDPTIEGMPNTHRVVEIQDDNGSPLFITQGDASDTPDAYPVKPAQLVGRYVRHLRLGKVLDLIHSRYFFFVMLLVLISVIFVEFLRVKTAAEKRKGDDNATGV